MKEIALAGKMGAGLFAMVDDDDFDRLSVFPWYALRNKGSRTVYARTIITGITVYMHHMVLPLKDGLETEHDDRNGLNNQSHNLKRVSHQVNMQNASPLDLIRDHVHAVTSKGRTYYYHRKTRTRLPDNPESLEFRAVLNKLNQEQKTA